MIVNEGVGGGGKKLPELSNPGAAGDALSGKQFINQDGEIVTGTIASKGSSNVSVSGRTVTVPAGYYPSQVSKSVGTATQATPSISVSSSGLITASATQSAGYVSSGTKSKTYQLTTQAGKTVTPSTAQQTAVASGRYTTGTVYVAGDSDLIAGNIRKGINIFGVTGTYEGEIKDLVAIEITNDSNTSVYVCYINSSDYLSYNDTRIDRQGGNDTIYAIRNTVVAIIGGGSAAAGMEDWNNELELIYDGHNSAAYYIPTNAGNSAHIVIS